MKQKHGGHSPGHVRDLFIDAIDAFCDWNGEDPEPTVTHEINYKPHEIPISKACGLLWHCTDQLPGDAVSSLKDCNIEVGNQTYAAAAHALRDAIRNAPRIVSPRI